ncbi:iscS, partial [Symbiodinium sp. KB8]
MEGAAPPAAGAGIGPAQPSTEGFHEGCIFMDYNGTTPVDKDVARAAHDAMLQAWGNPSSSHEYGQTARAALEQARAQVASLFNLGPPSVTFTSGGTEASNWAILGTIRRVPAPPTTVEHCATQRTLAFAQSQGLATVTTLAVDGEGFLSPAAAAAAVTRHTVLLTLMHSNNEVGTLQDIASIVSAARGAADGNPHPLLVHVDASQSLGKVPVEGLPAAGADFITVAGHKLYAPKGIGALVACSVPPERMPAPLLFGGGQEAGRRPGTEPVPCAVALGAACEAAGASLASGGRARLEALRAALLQGIAEGLGAAAGSAEEPHPFVTHGPAATERRLPNTLSIAFPGVAARELQAALAGKLAVSAGAACKESGLASPSHVLTAMGMPAEVALSTVRCSVGKFTTLAQVQRAAELIVGAVTALRKAAQRPPLALETDRLYMRDSQQLECDAVIVASGRCEALEGSGGK